MAYKNSLKTVLIDLSGTLHIENTPTPNAVTALTRYNIIYIRCRLRETGVNIKFVTNTTKEPRRLLHERLTKIGFDIKPDEIFSSLWAARDLIKKDDLRPLYLCEDSALEDFKGIDLIGDDLNAVVVGLAPDKFNWISLTEAFRLLITGGKLIAIHEGRYYKRSDGLALGPGPFVKALEYAADTKATVVGKPSSDFFKAALGDYKPSEAVMIGDDVRDDVGGAQNIGIKGYLVKTGKYLPNDESKIHPPPYKTVDNFSEAVDDIIKLMS